MFDPCQKMAHGQAKGGSFSGRPAPHDCLISALPVWHYVTCLERRLDWALLGLVGPHWGSQKVPGCVLLSPVLPGSGHEALDTALVCLLGHCSEKPRKSNIKIFTECLYTRHWAPYPPDATLIIRFLLNMFQNDTSPPPTILCQHIKASGRLPWTIFFCFWKKENVSMRSPILNCINISVPTKNIPWVSRNQIF